MKLDLTESTTVEFKETLPAGGINKQIIAFANTCGGTIYIGVADDATVVGVEDVDNTCQQITNMARDAIEPDVMMFLDCHLENIADKLLMKRNQELREENEQLKQYLFHFRQTVREMVKELPGKI